MCVSLPYASAASFLLRCGRWRNNGTICNVSGWHWKSKPIALSASIKIQKINRKERTEAHSLRTLCTHSHARIVCVHVYGIRPGSKCVQRRLFGNGSIEPEDMCVCARAHFLRSDFFYPFKFLFCFFFSFGFQLNPPFPHDVYECCR